MPKPSAPIINWNNPITKGLIFNAALFEGGGTTPFDLVQLKKGVLTNAPTWSNSLLGKTMLFAGASTQTVQWTPTFPATVSGIFSVEILFRPTNSGANPVFATRFRAEHSFDIQYNSSTGQVHGDVGDGTNWLNTAMNATLSPVSGANQWLQVIYTITASGYVIFANGVQVGTGSTGANPLLYNSSYDIGIGSDGTNGGNTYFTGNIAYARAWKRLLLPTEAKQLFINPWSIYKQPTLPGLNTGIFR